MPDKYKKAIDSLKGREAEIEKRKKARAKAKAKDPGKERRAKLEAAADKGMAVHKKSPKAIRVTTLKSIPTIVPKKRPAAEEEKKKQPLAGPGREPLTGLGEDLPAGRKKKKKDDDDDDDEDGLSVAENLQTEQMS